MNITQTAETRSEPRRRAKWQFWVRALVSTALLLYVFLVVVPVDQVAEVYGTLISMDLFYLAVSVLLVYVERLLSCFKWLVLLRVRSPDVRAMPVIQVFFVTSFLGYLLPSSIGGDALRIYSYGRFERDMAVSAGSVVLDRAYGTLGMLLLGAFSLLLAGEAPIPWSDALLILGAALGVLTIVLLLSSRGVHRFIERMGGLNGGGAVRGRLLRLTAAFSSFVGEKGRLLQVFFFSLGVQVLRVVIVMFLGMSLGVRLHPFIYFVYVPIITAITFLPISLGGVGVREFLFLHFFHQAAIGVEASACISLSLLYFAMGIVGTIPGAIIYLFTGLSGRDSRAEQRAEDV